MPLIGSGGLTDAQKTKLDGIAEDANNYVHPNHSGDVTSVADGATTITDGAVTNVKLADMATQTVKGRSSAETGSPEDLSVATLKTMLTHDLDEHGAVTLAELNAKISDATIPSNAGATTDAAGLVELATEAETQAGTDTTRAVTPAGLGAWARTGSMTVTVGATGDYSTINAALTALCKRYPGHGATAEISLLSGFVMAETVLADGQNLGWITITGVDACTEITLSALTGTTAFKATNGGVLPVISQQFEMDTQGGMGVVALGSGSSVSVYGSSEKSAGVSNCQYGILSVSGGHVFSRYGDFTGTSLFCAMAKDGGILTLLFGNYRKTDGVDGSGDIVTQNASLVMIRDSTGGTNITPNSTPTASGLIMKQS